VRGKRGEVEILVQTGVLGELTRRLYNWSAALIALRIRFGDRSVCSTAATWDGSSLKRRA
jgi:hypothetical protein